MSPDEAPPSYDFAAGDPLPRMPWEEPDRGFLSRLWSTLASTFHPVRDVARVSHGPIQPALRFALITSLPLMALAGIIPLTRQLFFGMSGSVEVAAGASQDSITLDVLAGAGLGIVTLTFACVFSAAVFALLARFASDPALTPVNPGRAAWRVSLYRAWLLPTAMLCFFVVQWLGPEPGPVRASLLQLVFIVVPCVIQMLNFSSTARYSGSSAWAGLPVSFLPLLAYWYAIGMVAAQLVLSGYLPSADGPK